MGYKIKNITYLLDKSNINYNKQLSFKIKDRFLLKEYKILPYQEIIFDGKLLPLEIKKMEMMGLVKCDSIDDNFINSINNPKKDIPKPKTEVKKQQNKKRTSIKKEEDIEK